MALPARSADRADGVDVAVSVVVVSYRSHELLELDHFRELSADPRVRLVVVDSYSTEDERAAVAALCQDRGWDLVGLATNPGFGGGVNAGVERARSGSEPDAVVVLNPDAVAAPSVVVELALRVRESPSSLVCPRIDRPDGSVWFAGGALDLRTGRTRTREVDPTTVEHPWLTGACLAVHPTLWDRVGGLDERYFMYWEDLDLSHRARAAGGRLVVADDLRVVHLVGATQGETKSDLYRRYNCRNRLLFAALHLGRRDYRAWVRGSIGYARLVLLRDGRRPLLRRGVPMVWSVVRGTAEGLWLGARVRGVDGRRRAAVR